MFQNSNTSIQRIFGMPISREAALACIQTDIETYETFLHFPLEHQERLLSFLEGNAGLKVTYDNFFKKIMDPDIHPERLEHFLSALLHEKIKIKQVLPLEGTKMVENGSFVIMDILTELSDGTYMDVEIQKIGYAFPGERSSCYLSDLIMRQYNRVKSIRGNQFTFKDMKPVHLIVLMEHSADEFSAVAPHYLHHKTSKFDSGADVKFLENIFYISLDTFHSVVQNIDTELEAWLTFLSSDDPVQITKLVNAYPEFLSCYEDILAFRQNPKELISMFSEALYILDRNTEKYMYEEMQKKLKEQEAKLADNTVKLANQYAMIADKDAEIADKDAEIADKDAEIADKDAEIADKDAEIAELKRRLTESMR